MKSSSLPMRILQGFLVLAIGVVIIVVNFSSLTTSFQKVSGNITDTYEENVSGSYQASYLVIEDSSDIFIFNKNNFNPVWNDAEYTGQRVDIYYQDGTPKKVGAITLYNFSGEPIQTFTTPDYVNASKNVPHIPIGLIIRAIVTLLGYVWLMGSLWIFVRLRLSARAKLQDVS